LKAHCNGTGIAAILGISAETLYRRCQEDHKMVFDAYSAQKKAEGVSLMEASIFRDAINYGGVDRIFWLKNKAAWKEKSETDITSNGKTIFITLPENE
jgi:hypothetical protein